MDLTFFDVETPNKKNDRISSIGLIRATSEGKIIDRVQFTVNPEEPFDDFNMRLTGLSPVAVKDSPCFRSLWENELSDRIEGSILVAHNAPFDLSVLSKSLLGYGYEKPDFVYACTLEMAKRLHPEYENYKLPTVCSNLDISMGCHHNAMDDVDACFEIYWKLCEEERSEERFKSFSLGSLERHERRTCHERHYSSRTEALRGLIALSHKVISDGSVSFDEAMSIMAYIEGHIDLREDATVSRIYELMAEMLIDGDIDSEESDGLIELFGRLEDPVAHGSGKEVCFEGRNFCLSGNFEHGPKDAIASYIEKMGGSCVKSVTKKCNYVVVGGCGNEMWSTGKYGSKVKKAMDWQNKGVPIEIIGEGELGM